MKKMTKQRLMHDNDDPNSNDSSRSSNIEASVNLELTNGIIRRLRNWASSEGPIWRT